MVDQIQCVKFTIFIYACKYKFHTYILKIYPSLSVLAKLFKSFSPSVLNLAHITANVRLNRLYTTKNL